MWLRSPLLVSFPEPSSWASLPPPATASRIAACTIDTHATKLLPGLLSLAEWLPPITQRLTERLIAPMLQPTRQLVPQPTELPMLPTEQLVPRPTGQLGLQPTEPERSVHERQAKADAVARSAARASVAVVMPAASAIAANATANAFVAAATNAVDTVAFGATAVDSTAGSAQASSDEAW